MVPLVVAVGAFLLCCRPILLPQGAGNPAVGALRMGAPTLAAVGLAVELLWVISRYSDRRALTCSGVITQESENMGVVA